jgi:hypothetical protein
MSRPLRIAFPGAVYHVTSRGNVRQDMVADDRDRVQFLAIVLSVCPQYPICDIFPGFSKKLAELNPNNPQIAPSLSVFFMGFNNFIASAWRILRGNTVYLGQCLHSLYFRYLGLVLLINSR